MNAKHDLAEALCQLLETKTLEKITVKDLTERIGKPAGEILKKLLMLGNMANINTELDFDTFKVNIRIVKSLK